MMTGGSLDASLMITCEKMVKCSTDIATLYYHALGSRAGSAYSQFGGVTRNLSVVPTTAKGT
jgi:hypothetical protein